jgi:hypothetical protein
MRFLRQFAVLLVVAAVLRPPASVAAQPPYVVLLPGIWRGFEIVTTWAYTQTCSVPLSPPVQTPALFPGGVRLLEVRFLVDGLPPGTPWSTEWRVNDVPNPGLNQQGLLPANRQVTVRLVVGPNGTCLNPLPNGMYWVNLYLNGLLLEAAIAVLQ